MSTEERRTAGDRWVIAASSVLGLGRLPVAPGTFGALAGLPVWWALEGSSWTVWVSACAALTFLSIAVAGRADRLYPGHDSGEIVIDELAGMVVTASGLPFRPSVVVVGFLLFRLFDVVKPPPIRWIDRRCPGGAGIVLDDVVAGVFACALLHLILWIGGPGP